MNAIRIRRKLTSHVIDLPELRPMVGKAVEIIVLEEAETQKDTLSHSRQSGSAKGKVKMAPDFDAPLDDFAEYM
jgi:hypothetical protein